MFARGSRWFRAEWPFVLIVALFLATVGYLYLFPGHWRRASAVMGLALLLAAGLRLGLAPERVGLLAVRGRWRDALCYLALGGVILGVAIRLH